MPKHNFPHFEMTHAVPGGALWTDHNQSNRENGNQQRYRFQCKHRCHNSIRLKFSLCCSWRQWWRVEKQPVRKCVLLRKHFVCVHQSQMLHEQLKLQRQQHNANGIVASISTNRFTLN